MKNEVAYQFSDLYLPGKFSISYVKATKTPLRNLQRPLRLHDDALETHRRWSAFGIGRDLKIYMQLP